MPLPELVDSGELPLGVHRASLHETLARFGFGNPQRVAVGERLERIHRVAEATGRLVRFIVYGSFVTDKPEPNDVDVFLVMDDSFDGDTLQSETAVLFDHAAADAHFGASVIARLLRRKNPRFVPTTKRVNPSRESRPPTALEGRELMRRTSEIPAGLNPLRDWRSDPPTEGQIACADRLGIRYSPDIRRGDLSDVILAKLGVHARRRFQFGLRKLLLWTTAVALVFSAGAQLGKAGIVAASWMTVTGGIRAATNRTMAGLVSAAGGAMAFGFAAYVGRPFFWLSLFAAVLGFLAGSVLFALAEAVYRVVDWVDILMEARNNRRTYRL